MSKAAFVSAMIMAVGFFSAGWTTSFLEDSLYSDEIIYAKTTPYQRLVVTRWRDDLRLFINGNIQFSSVDEFRYHEALVHPAMSMSPRPVRVLLLGGGDGLGAREVLKYSSVHTIDLVDLDAEVTRIFAEVAPWKPRSNVGVPLFEPHLGTEGEEVAHVALHVRADRRKQVAERRGINGDRLA